MNASRMLSFGRAAVNDSSNRRPGGIGFVGQPATAATTYDPNGGASSATTTTTTATTTIATTLTVLISSDVTQAYDNDAQQDSHWMIESPNRSAPATINTFNSITSNANELIVAHNLVDQQQQQLHHQQQLQQSFSDWWQEYWSRQPFPSGYTQSSITLVACLLTTIIFLIVVGNLLVCIAIFTEKSLKPTQNWFIASLAVSDMLLGLVVMPFSLARELMGFWIFGPIWCDIHEALDVLLTTASINTLCLISLDRYWSITQAVNYLKKRTPRRAVCMIAFVWVSSAVISLPPLIGWKKPSPVVTAPALGGGSSMYQSNATRQAKEQQKPRSSSDRRPQRPKLVDIDDDNEDSYANEGQARLVGKQEDSIVDESQSGTTEEDAAEKAVENNGEQNQWQRKRRRRRRTTRNGHEESDSMSTRLQMQPPPAVSLSSAPLIPSRLDCGQQLMAAVSSNKRHSRFNRNSDDIPDMADVTTTSLQQPVINYAYLASEQQLQLEQQQQQQQQQQQTNEYPTCQLSDDIGYVLYSALGSFFIPCAVMVFTYIKIGLAARKRARRAINKQARAHQQGGLGGVKRGAAGGLQRRTIAGTTSGRASKQQPVGDSALMLTPTLAALDVEANDSQVPELDTDQDNQIMFSAGQRRNNSVAGASSGHHHHRNSRSGNHVASAKLDSARDCATTTPLMMGKLVVVERQKVSLPPSATMPMQQDDNKAIAAAGNASRPLSECQELVVGGTAPLASATTSPANPVEELHDDDDESDCCATATLVTSGSKLASPSALKYSNSCEGISSSLGHTKQHQVRQGQSVVAGQHHQHQHHHHHKKPTSESNDSSLITVMSASMNELPQVTRFKFAPATVAPPNQTKTITQSVESSEQRNDDDCQTGQTNLQQTAAVDSSLIGDQDEEKQRAAALLKAISLAGRELADDSLAELNASEPSENDKIEENSISLNGRETTGKSQQQQQQQPVNNSTNETCFMTIEEDSDNLDAQTGRTIMMIASTAKQSTCSLANKNQVGMMMTMMPPAAGTPGGNSDLSTIVCNNVACLRRQARRQANRRQNSSYCGSSMTINGDEDDDEEEDEEGEEEEEDDDDDDEEDDLMENGDSIDDDECLEDDLLTDDCNGYSGSCRLDPYCTGTASSTCTHCRECAALSGGKPPLSGDCTQDSPLSCAYKYSKSTPQDSPQLHASGQPPNKRTSKRFMCQRHHSTLGQHHQHQDQTGGCNISETEGQSLTGDDNLSLTDYYRSNEDNSSVVGHDVLDATPAREHLGPKRRSIVASAIATVGGGLNRMTSAAAASGGGQQSNQQQVGGTATAAAAATGRKKSSIGFHLTRFGSGGGSGSNATSPLPPTSGGLLALAAASQQQQQTGANATRNLKTLRQNFFHKLNQLTAKSAAKQDHHNNKLANRGRSPIGGKSSVHSSYGSSYEPSVDCATTSNIHSTNDQYNAETTFDDYEQQTSAETTKQSSDQISSGGAGGGQQSPVGKLVSIANQQAIAANTRQHNLGRLAINDKDINHNQRTTTSANNNQNQRSQALTSGNSSGLTGNKRMQLMSTTDDDPNLLAQSSSQMSLTTEGERNNQHSLNGNERHSLIGKTNLRNNDDRTLIGNNSGQQPMIGTSNAGTKRRSNDRGASMALVCSSQGSNSDQRPTGTNTTGRGQGGAGGPSSGGGGGGNVISKAFLASDNERHKRKLAKARERRATLILGLIMATFICCWFPFFSFYVLRAVCHVCRDYIPPRLEAFIFWMGYCNSAMNPIIYTIFNRDFRKAFRKILFRCSRE